MTTVGHHGLAAAVRDHAAARLPGADPHAVLPVLGVIAAAAAELQGEHHRAESLPLPACL